MRKSKGSAGQTGNGPLAVFCIHDIKIEREKDMETGLVLQHGHPGDLAGRIETELAVYDLLDFLKIDYDRVDHEAAYTMEACEAIDRILEPAAICKNLFYATHKKQNFQKLSLLKNRFQWYTIVTERTGQKNGESNTEF